MEDYEPLDLSGHCNAGVSLLDETIPLGSQTLHGLPFQIGAAQPKTDHCLLSFGPDAAGGMEIEVGSQASRIVFAHRLLESKIGEGGPIGEQVGEYAFHIDGGGGVSSAGARAIRDLRCPLRPRHSLPCLSGSRRQGVTALRRGLGAGGQTPDRRRASRTALVCAVGVEEPHTRQAGRENHRHGCHSSFRHRRHHHRSRRRGSDLSRRAAGCDDHAAEAGGRRSPVRSRSRGRQGSGDVSVSATGDVDG